jgi:hypothetical protein
VTEEEIAAQLEEGLDAGVIEEQEHQMVRNVFRLDDRQIGSMMIPRAEIDWLDANGALDDVVATIVEHGHTRYPVCRGGLDDVIGVLGAHRCCSRWHAVSAPTWPRCSTRRSSCPRRCRAWSCWSISAPPRPTSSSWSTNMARCRA